jgi:hypothetical protein
MRGSSSLQLESRVSYLCFLKYGLNMIGTAGGVRQPHPIPGRKSQEDIYEKFHLHGQPQCLRNAMITGLPSLLGRDRNSVEGAVLPIPGTTDVSTGVGDSQDDSSCCSGISPVDI